MSAERVVYEDWQDEELAVAAKEGNREARNVLFLRHEQRFQRLVAPVKRLVAKWSYGDKSIAPEDVDQQLFLIFCELLDSWDRARTPFISYATSMVRWHAFHFVRASFHARARVRVEHEASHEAWLDVLNEQEVSTPEEIDTTPVWRDYTSKLKPDWKRWVELRFEQGMSSVQIATVSGCSRRTIDRELRAAVHSMLTSIRETWQCE